MADRKSDRFGDGHGMNRSRGPASVALGTVVCVAATRDLRETSRILVYGVTGSGKSTMAAAISSATGIPWYSVDDLTWEPGWMEVPIEEQRLRIDAIYRKEQGRSDPD